MRGTGFIVSATHHQAIFGEFTAMTRGFGAIAARRHVAPAASPILRSVEKHARATLVGTAANAHELAQHEGIGGRLDDGDHQACERVAHRNEAAYELSIRSTLETANARTPAQHAIDLAYGVLPNVMRRDATLGQRTQHRAHAACVREGRRRACRLLLSAPPNTGCPFGVQHRRSFEPAEERVEITQRVSADSAVQIIRVDEIQPQPLAEENELASCVSDGFGHGGKWRAGTLVYPRRRPLARRAVFPPHKSGNALRKHCVGGREERRHRT